MAVGPEWIPPSLHTQTKLGILARRQACVNFMVAVIEVLLYTSFVISSFSVVTVLLKFMIEKIHFPTSSTRTSE